MRPPMSEAELKNLLSIAVDCEKHHISEMDVRCWQVQSMVSEILDLRKKVHER